MIRTAIIDHIDGSSDLIEASYAVRQPESNIVTFYSDTPDTSTGVEVVAMYNMNNIAGWGFNDSEDDCDGCPESYIMGVVDCWNFFERTLDDIITVPNIRAKIKRFFEDNDPIESVLEFVEDEEDDEENS